MPDRKCGSQGSAGRIGRNLILAFRLKVLVSCSLLLVVSVVGCKNTSTDESATKDADHSSANSIESRNSESDVAVHLVDAEYVSDSKCAPCHQELWDSYQKVGMAQSAYTFDAKQPIEDFEDGHFYHEASNKHYEMKMEDGQLVMTRYRKRKDGTRTDVYQKKVDFVIGSGNHARTYAYRDSAGAMFELPVSWYSQESKWAMSPGYDRSDHDGFTREIPRGCMFCHNAYPDHKPGRDVYGTPDRFPEHLPHGVGCQRCHGPGSEHVRFYESGNDSQESGDSTIINPAKLEAQLRDDVCNQCHFQPTSARTISMEDFGKSTYSFRPGQKLTDYAHYYELADAQDNDVFEVNHHPYRLYQSECYIASKGAMSCTTCHDPHVKLAPEKLVEHHRAKCLSCHGNDDCLDVELGRTPTRTVSNATWQHVVRKMPFTSR